MTELIIKGGYVFDPLNKIDGEKKDIYIKDGKVVYEVKSKDAKVIDAQGKTVMPGGVDLHSHIAGSKINIGRLLRPEDHRKDNVPKSKAKVNFHTLMQFHILGILKVIFLEFTNLTSFVLKSRLSLVNSSKF